MPEAKPLDFSDIGTLAKENSKDSFDFSDIGTPSDSSIPPLSVKEFEEGGVPGTTNEFARGVARGTANSAASVLDFVRTFADSDTLKQTSDSLSTLARNIPSKASSLDDLFDDPTLIPAYVGKVAGELAPQAVMAYLSGGTGATLGRAAGLSRAGVRVATGAGAAVTSIPQEVGQIARETEELTGKIDSTAALSYGIPSGMLDALSAERIIGKVFRAGQPSRRAWRQVVRDTLAEIPKTAAVESLTETAQEGLHLLADRAADDTFNLLNRNNGMRLLESAVAGAIGGGLLGGGASLIQLPAQKSARNQAAQDIRLTRGLERDLKKTIIDLVPSAPTDNALIPPVTPRYAPVVQSDGASSILDLAGERTPVDDLLSQPRSTVPQPQPESQPEPIPTRLVPVLTTPDGEIISAGLTHGNALENSPRDRGVDAIAAYERDSEHRFLDLNTGKVLTRDEAGGIQSEDIPISERTKNLEEWIARNTSNKPKAPDAQQPQTLPVPVQTPSALAQEEQAKSVPPDIERVRQAQAQPSPEVRPGTIEVIQLTDEDVATALKPEDLNRLKTEVEVQYDPGKARKGREFRESSTRKLVAVIGNRKTAGKLLIQIPGKTAKTVWSANLSDLRQAGIAEDAGNGRFRINLEQLWKSNLLQKNPDRDFAAYKLPTEKLERSVDVEVDQVIGEASKLNSFLGAVLGLMRDNGTLTTNKIKSLAGARTGGAEHAGKTSARLAQQIRDFINRVLVDKIAEISSNIDTMSGNQKREALGLAQAKEKLESGNDYTDEDAQVLSAYLSNVSEIESVDKPESEVSIEEVRGTSFGDNEVGEDSGENPIGATWDPARTDTIIGRVEDTDPELYQSFAADPENDRAWEEIEKNLVKFFNGDKLAAEIMAEAVRQKRMEGWVASIPEEVQEFEEHNWLNGISATGKDGILALFENRNINIPPDMRRIALALLKKIPARYLEDLTFNVTLDGRLEGEFIPWLKVAKVAINSTDPQVAAHELSHYLAAFLTEKERSKISNLRASDIAVARQDPANKQFFDWLDSLGGNALSSDYAKWRDGRSDVVGAASLGTPFRFATSTEIALGQDKPFGITKDRNGFVPKQTLIARMKGQVAKEELAALAPILDTLPDRVNALMLAERIKNDGPQLEVVKLNADVAPTGSAEDVEITQQFNQIQHDLDTVGIQNRGLDVDRNANRFTKRGVDFWIDNDGAILNPNNVPLMDGDINLLNNFARLHGPYSEAQDRVEWIESEDSATANYQFVNPKPLKDMPGAVDILVRVPRQAPNMALAREMHQRGERITQLQTEGVKFTGGHFGNSDKNIIGWVRGYIDTTPSGEKVFHVFEVQSDWAQTIRNAKEYSRANNISKPLTEDDPALAFYESAALKAAIRHARELGITKVAISDAETAMITEGHDRGASFTTGEYELNKNILASLELNFPASGRVRILESNGQRDFQIQSDPKSDLRNAGEWRNYYLRDMQRSPEFSRWLYGIPRAIKQEPGMRLHYDQTLPNIMAKLAGTKPEIVDFGEHQNVLAAIRQPNPNADNFNEIVRRGEIREDLIFKNKDGTPKTTITARMFDVSGVDVNVPAQMFRSSLYSVAHPLYRLINDDEYFAHYMSEAAGRIKDPELRTIIDKVVDALRQLFDAVKAWLGNRDSHFNQLIRRFERGEFLVHENGGMLFEKNNKESVKSLPPIKSLTELRKFSKVDTGADERRMINKLTIEQNQPLIGAAIPAIDGLDRRIRAELPGLTSRAAALIQATKMGAQQEDTPLKYYAVLVNGLGIQEEAKRLGEEINQLLDDIKRQNRQGEKSSAAEARAKHLEQTAQDLISDYKSFLLSEQRSSRNSGVADGLVEAIRSIDSMRNSTESLKRSLEFLAETMSLEELTNPSQNTQQIVDLFKQRIMSLTGATSWQQAVIPAGGEKPGISNEQLRLAVRMMQERQHLVQDIITYKELSDPELANLMANGQVEFDNQIASLTYRQLRSFLSSYYSVRSKKDKARHIYLKHRARLKDLIDKLSVKTEAETFLFDKVIGTEQFQQSMEEAAHRGFMSAELVRDNSGADVLKRTYYNPLNREESLDIIDGTTQADFQSNIDNYDIVAKWYEDALEDPGLDPLDKERINLELARIYEVEMNPVYSPASGKRSPGAFNLPNVLSNLTGASLSFTMQKIGGRAAVQASAVFQARSEARRRTAEVRHEMQYPLQIAVITAAKEHDLPISRWIKEIAEPVLASYNSIGSRLIKAGDNTRYGHRVSGRDMEAVREMKKVADAMTKASSDMSLNTARLHPIKVKEIVGGREILREQQGGTELVVPRRFSRTFTALLDNWSRAKNGRKASTIVPTLRTLIQSGHMFEEMVLSHIYSTQRYPDYANTTKFSKAYREIYNRILNGNTPTSFDQVVDIVFEEQSGQDVAGQLSKDDIVRAIITNEIDVMAGRVLEQQSKDRAADTPGQSMSIQSADNFMTKARGQMIAPDTGYQYSIASQDDIRWLTRSVLEVHEQLARDGLEKIKKMLQEYLVEWDDRSKHPSPQKESRAKQISGEDWMNHREARQMLNQINRHLDLTSPDSFRTFLDDQFGGMGRKAWGIVVQSLLQSATVLKNNFLGMNLRLWQFDQQWRGDGLWMGMPKWLLKMPTMAKNGIAWPVRDLPAYFVSAYAYKQAKKKVKVNGLIGEDALHAIIGDPDLFRTASTQISGYLLRRAVNVQRARELGAAGSYGAKNQIMRYIKMGVYGGEMEEVDPNNLDKAKGLINSALGLFQETGGGFMLPKALAPRKLEQFLNFQAIRHADRVIGELTLNLQEAIKDRAEANDTSSLTDAELLGDSTARDGDAMYMRSIFNRAGLNLDALTERLGNNPGREMLTPPEWNSFVLEVAKEMNMPSSDNRVVYKSGFAKLMSSLMGYGMWYNERLAEALAGSSRKKFDGAAVYRGMFFLGTIAAMGILIGTPIQRLIKRILFDEEDQTGRFSADNTSWRNAGVLWEQTVPFWPIIGSVFSQLYDARAGGGKIFNFLPVSISSQAIQTANEIGQTGHVFYPLLKLLRSWDPNTKIIINRLPEFQGLTEVANTAKTFREVASGDIEIRANKGGTAIRYSPTTTQITMAVNELAKEDPDYDAIKHYRDDAVKVLMKKGASREDAQRRFDLSVLARFPQNTVYGRTLSAQEKLKQLGRMDMNQIARLSKIENAFDFYANTFGLRSPSEPPRLRNAASVGRSRTGGRLRRGGFKRRRSSRLVRNRNIRRRSRGLIRY